MTGRRPDYLEGLFVDHHAAVAALAHLYHPADDADEPTLVGACHTALADLIRRVDVIGTNKGRKLSAAQASYLYRAVERALALAAIVDAQYRQTHAGASVFEGELRDGYRLLKKHFESRPVRWAMILRASAVPGEVVSGVVADNLTLLAELLEFAPGNDLLVSDARGTWINCSTALRLFLQEDPDHLRLDLEALGAKEFVSITGMRDGRELRAAVRQGRVLEAESWEGKNVYPSVQLDVSTGKLISGLASLLPRLRRGSLSGWRLAHWLSQPYQDTDTPIIELLDSRLDDILADLRRFRVVLDDTDTSPSTYTPTREDVEALRDSGENSTIKRRKKQTRPLYRITDSQFGPFYFSTGNSRFDPPQDGVVAPLFGTCYLAMSPMGALSESLRRSPIMDLEDVFQKTIWTVSLLSDLAGLLDLDANQNLDPHFNRSIRRTGSQALAGHARDAGYSGIVHRLYEGSDSDRGVALFGSPGRSAPESGALPAYSTSFKPLAYSQEYWDWLSTELSMGITAFTREQLPARVAVRP